MERMEPSIIAMLNSIYRAAPTGIGMVRNRVFCQVNDRVCEITGYSREDLIGQSSRLVYPSQEEFDHVGRVKYDQVRRLGIGSVETRWQRKDGTIVDILLSSAPLDIQDLSLGVVFTAMDITERKKAEAALAESESKFRAIASHTPDHIIMQDLDLRYTYVVNPQLGLTEADMIGKTDRDFLAPDDAEKLIAAKRKVLETGQSLPFAVSVTNRMGQQEHFEGSYIPKLDANRRVNGLIGYFHNITDRKRAEEALRESEKMLQESQIIAGLGSYVLDIPTGLWKSSAVLDQVFGIDSAYQRSVEGWGPLIHPDDRQQMVDYFANEVLGKGVRFDREYRIIRHDNQAVRWVHGLGNLEFDAQRHPLKMFGTIQDITEGRRAEEALRESERRLSTLISNLPGFIYRCANDPDWTMEFISGGCREITGYSADDFVHNKRVAFNDIVHPDHRQRLWKKWQNLLSRREPFEDEYPILTADGQTRWVWERGRGIFSDDGRLLFLEGFITDVTERKQAESKLRESEEKFSKTFRLSPEMISISRLSDGTYYEANEAFERIMGYSRQETIGHTSAELGIWVDPQDRARMVEVLRKRSGLHQFETKVFRKDRSIITALFSASPIEIRGEQYLLAIVMDITERIRAEQQREQLLKALQAKTEELESIIYVSSHDLRSPLVNIQGFSGELGESCRQVRKLISGDSVPQSDHQQLDELLGQDIPSALEYITTSVSKLDALQKGLLKICRIGRETLEIGPIAMNELIDGTLKSIRYQLDNCQAQVLVDPLPNCLADAAQLTQVFTNLIDNAIKYRGPDRSLVIRIYGRIEDTHSVYAVADNGVGIAPEHQQKVFEMFHQLDPLNGPGGEGLGLTIVKRILGRMDGQVRLESAVGVGSVFFVILPKV
jgi:PAS domain S-box-containing protein